MALWAPRFTQPAWLGCAAASSLATAPSGSVTCRGMTHMTPRSRSLRLSLTRRFNFRMSLLLVWEMLAERLHHAQPDSETSGFAKIKRHLAMFCIGILVRTRLYWRFRTRVPLLLKFLRCPVLRSIGSLTANNTFAPCGCKRALQGGGSPQKRTKLPSPSALQCLPVTMSQI